MRSYQDLGGTSLTVDWKVGPGRLNSTTAWRYWDWKPSNDRDFIGLPVTTISAAPSYQDQWTQEIRYAGTVSPKVNVVGGAFFFRQALDSDPSFKQEQGSAAARFLLAPTANAATPGLLDGYGFNQYLEFRNTSAAVFGQLEWLVSDRLRVLPGLRFNYDQKNVDFDQQVYGGLQTTDPALDRPAAFDSSRRRRTRRTSTTPTCRGRSPARIKVTTTINAYATYSTGFKSVGLNLNGLPTDALGRPILSAAVVKPEDTGHIEVGLKTEPFPASPRTSPSTTPRSTTSRRRSSTPRGCASRLSRQRGEGARARRRVRRHRPGERQPLALHVRRLHGRQVRLLPGRAAAARGHRRTGGQGHLGLAAAWHLQVGAFARRRVRQAGARSSAGPDSSSVRSTAAIGPSSRRARARRSIWWSTATPCSTPGSASAGRMAGRCTSGRATCSTRTTTSCCRRRLATPVSMSVSPAIREPLGVTLRVTLR